jgi:hypothetical protein
MHYDSHTVLCVLEVRANSPVAEPKPGGRHERVHFGPRYHAGVAPSNEPIFGR